tara:strand:+ start:1374 stop:1934 length:561 start_codon:yes stop_codon:yes gene_type:complete
MADKFLRPILREISNLEEQLSGNPQFVRWQALKAVEEAYKSTNVTESGTNRVRETHDSDGVYPQPMGAPRPESKAAPIIDAAVDCLKTAGRRMTSTEMAPKLIAKGIALSGRNQAATLSAYLSAAREIDNIRGQGYGLTVWATQAPHSANPEGEPPDNNSEETEDPKKEAPDSMKLTGASTYVGHR